MKAIKLLILVHTGITTHATLARVRGKIDNSNSEVPLSHVYPMRRVLVVDDDQGTLDTFKAILRLEGFQVATAGTGQEAVDLARHHAADLILADLRLPDISGIDILRATRAAQIDIPIVIMTAFGSVASAVEALKVGARDYVEKPLDEAALLNVIRRAADTTNSASVPTPRLAEDTSGPDCVELSPAVAAARAFIDAHYRDRLTYEVIGRSVGRDAEYLEIQFHQECGKTLHGYQREIQLRKAYDLALAGAKIESLPETVGFRSKSGFFRAFRRMFGRTPGSLAGSSKARAPETKER